MHGVSDVPVTADGGLRRDTGDAPFKKRPSTRGGVVQPMASMMTPTADKAAKTLDDCYGIQLLFEIEHSVQPRRPGRPLPKAKDQKDVYEACAEACVRIIFTLLQVIGFEDFSILVNRRPLRSQRLDEEIRRATLSQDWVKFPDLAAILGCNAPTDEVASDFGEDGFLEDGPANGEVRSVSKDPVGSKRNQQPQQAGQDVGLKPKPPPCSRAQSHQATRYPRPGSFEVSVYDVRTGSRRLLFSKYKQHSLPKGTDELVSSLLPFLILSLGRANEEKMMNDLVAFANARKILVNLSKHDLKESRGTSPLLDTILESLNELQQAEVMGSVEALANALETFPHNLRTPDISYAEQRLEDLRAHETRITDALSKIEAGLVTSGLELLKRAVEAAALDGLVGNILVRGLSCLDCVEGDGEFDEDAIVESIERAHRRLSDMARLKEDSYSHHGYSNPLVTKTASGREAGNGESSTSMEAAVWSAVNIQREASIRAQDEEKSDHEKVAPTRASLRVHTRERGSTASKDKKTRAMLIVQRINSKNANSLDTFGEPDVDTFGEGPRMSEVTSEMRDFINAAAELQELPTSPRLARSTTKPGEVELVDTGQFRRTSFTVPDVPRFDNPLFEIFEEYQNRVTSHLLDLRSELKSCEERQQQFQTAEIAQEVEHDQAWHQKPESHLEAQMRCQKDDQDPLMLQKVAELQRERDTLLPEQREQKAELQALREELQAQRTYSAQQTQDFDQLAATHSLEIDVFAKAHLSEDRLFAEIHSLRQELGAQYSEESAQNGQSTLGSTVQTKADQSTQIQSVRNDLPSLSNVDGAGVARSCDDAERIKTLRTELLSKHSQITKQRLELEQHKNEINDLTNARASEHSAFISSQAREKELQVELSEALSHTVHANADQFIQASNLRDDLPSSSNVDGGGPAGSYDDTEQMRALRTELQSQHAHVAKQRSELEQHRSEIDDLKNARASELTALVSSQAREKQLQAQLSDALGTSVHVKADQVMQGQDSRADLPSSSNADDIEQMKALRTELQSQNVQVAKQRIELEQHKKQIDDLNHARTSELHTLALSQAREKRLQVELTEQQNKLSTVTQHGNIAPVKLEEERTSSCDAKSVERELLETRHALAGAHLQNDALSEEFKRERAQLDALREELRAKQETMNPISVDIGSNGSSCQQGTLLQGLDPHMEAEQIHALREELIAHRKLVDMQKQELSALGGTPQYENATFANSTSEAELAQMNALRAEMRHHATEMSEIKAAWEQDRIALERKRAEQEAEHLAECANARALKQELLAQETINASGQHEMESLRRSLKSAAEQETPQQAQASLILKERAEHEKERNILRAIAESAVGQAEAMAQSEALEAQNAKMQAEAMQDAAESKLRTLDLAAQEIARARQAADAALAEAAALSAYPANSVGSASDAPAQVRSPSHSVVELIDSRPPSALEHWEKQWLPQQKERPVGPPPCMENVENGCDVAISRADRKRSLSEPGILARSAAAPSAQSVSSSMDAARYAVSPEPPFSDASAASTGGDSAYGRPASSTPTMAERWSRRVQPGTRLVPDSSALGSGVALGAPITCASPAHRRRRAHSAP